MVDGGWFYRGGFFFKVSFEPGFAEGSKPAHEEKEEDGEKKAEGKTRGLLSSLRAQSYGRVFCLWLVLKVKASMLGMPQYAKGSAESGDADWWWSVCLRHQLSDPELFV